ncbi:MAG: hypothetical protein FWG25_06935, partial [Promicromonosporaceae bacterium]|nr:hypothetical protein [Promicromonosporaceae bacterium]
TLIPSPMNSGCIVFRVSSADNNGLVRLYDMLNQYVYDVAENSASLESAQTDFVLYGLSEIIALRNLRYYAIGDIIFST